MNFSYIVAGIAVGLLVGLTGVGGGALMTPLLVFLFGFNPAIAVGTDLLFAAITKCLGVFVHHNSHSSVNWRIVGRLSAGTIPASIATLLIMRRYSELGRDLSAPITFALGVAVLLTALALLLKPQIRELGGQVPRGMIRWIGERRKVLTVLAGAILGSLVTLSSVGAGALGSVTLLLLYPSLPSVMIVGTDLAYAIPLAAVAGLGHWALGNVDLALLGSLLLGSLPGIWVGSHISARIPDRILRPILATVLILIGFKCLR